MKRKSLFTKYKLEIESNQLDRVNASFRECCCEGSLLIDMIPYEKKFPSRCHIMHYFKYSVEDALNSEDNQNNNIAVLDDLLNHTINETLIENVI